MDGANPHPESFPPMPGNFQGGQPLPYPEQLPPPYPSALPPPVPYPAPQRGVGTRVLLIVAALVVVLALIVGGVLYAVGSGERGLSATAARSTIQGYLDALLHQDKETVARHALCGLYDGVKDRSTDLTVANLASDAFRRQFSSAEVTSIDKIIMLSPNQAQVLFTMKVAPSGRSLRGSQTKSDIQAVAQLLVQPSESLVCSYLPRPSDSE
ncbi:MAG: hypothetical protein WCE30_10960 [Mycobacterium sp.]